MRIPNRFAPVLFGALLSAIMVGIVSAVVLAINQGMVCRVVGRMTA
jgi:hypothetical protein